MSMSAEVWTHLWADWSVAERRRTEAPVTLDAQTRQMVAANEADWDARVLQSARGVLVR